MGEKTGRIHGVEVDRHVSLQEAEQAADDRVGAGSPSTAPSEVPEPGDWSPEPYGVAKRPTEAVAGLGGGLVMYGFCTQVGLPQLPSAIVAVAVVMVPFLVSHVVDLIRASREEL